MINVLTRTGKLNVLRGQAINVNLSSVDLNNEKPSNLAATNNIHIIVYWRTLAGKLYETYATEASNSFTFSVPATILNPATTEIYAQFLWVTDDGQEQLFSIYDLTVYDKPSSFWNSYSIGFSYANQAQVDFMPATYYVNGHKIQVKIIQTGLAPEEGTGVEATIYADEGMKQLTLFTVAAQVAAQGQDIKCEIYKDGAATGNIITLVAGRTDALSLAITEAVG